LEPSFQQRKSGLLEQAIAIDRHYGPALSWMAICHLRFVVDGFAEAPETSCRKAIDFAQLALRAEENDPGILANAAFVLAYLGEDVGANDRADRPGAGSQPELRPRLVFERPYQDLGRSTRSCD
jgi:hypothetical protein